VKADNATDEVEPFAGGDFRVDQPSREGSPVLKSIPQQRLLWQRFHVCSSRSFAWHKRNYRSQSHCQGAESRDFAETFVDSWVFQKS